VDHRVISLEWTHLHSRPKAFELSHLLAMIALAVSSVLVIWLLVLWPHTVVMEEQATHDHYIGTSYHIVILSVIIRLKPLLNSVIDNEILYVPFQLT
jgi:hypothetical protein